MEREANERGQSTDVAAPANRSMTVDEARDHLALRYGIGAAFVRVSQLSKILGISAPTIYAAMREGRFFLPHRMLCSMPAVRLDDLAEWYGRQEQSTPKVRRQADENKPATNEQAAIDETREEIIARVLARVTEKHVEKRTGAKAEGPGATEALKARRRPRPQ